MSGKSIVMFLIGMIFGGFGAYVLTCNKYKKEIERLNRFYNEEIDKTVESINSISEDIPEDVKIHDEKSKISTFEKDISKAPTIDYTKYVNSPAEPDIYPFTTDEEEDAFIERYDAYVKTIGNYSAPDFNVHEPMLIDTISVDNIPDDYDIINITYYLTSNVPLYDDTDDMVGYESESMTLIDMIGQTNLDKFKEINTPVIYVLNNDAKTLFVVSKTDNDFPWVERELWEED